METIENTELNREDSDTSEELRAEGNIAEPALTEETIENEDPKLSRKKGKAAAFFDRYWLYFAAPILIFALFYTILYAYNIFPFSKTTMSNYDLLAQICPFIEHFYDVLDGKSSLFYSTAIMGGTDVFGTLAYCCVSPFTFLFLLCGKGNVYYAVSFVLPIKLSCIAGIAIYFIKKKFKDIPAYIVLAISLLYAYCGYTFVSNTYINWMDFLIYMPFVILGFEKLVKEKKIRYFAIAYALMIYTCFSIASFALLLVYLVFIAYALICVEKGERKEVIFKMVLSLVLAVGIALPIMVPSFFAYMRSGRNTGLFENLFKELSEKPLYAKLTYIFADTFFVFCSVVYLIRSKLKTREDKFLFVTGIIIMLPVLIDEVCLLLNAGSYMSYALRFGFLNAVYGLYLTGKLLNEAKNEKISKVKSGIFLAVFALIAAAALFLLIKYHVSVVETNNDKFSGPFAHSVGGIAVISIIAGGIAGLLILALIFYKCRLSTYRLLSYVLLAVFAVQMTFYNIYLVKGNLFDPVRYTQYNYISDTIKNNYETGSDGYYYRIKDYDDAISNAAPLTTHTNCFSVFSSVIDSANLVPTKFFGYDGNNINNIKSSGGLFFGDALLGYKYYYIHNDSYQYDVNRHKSMDRSYNKLLDDTQQSYFQGMLNTLCFPNAFTTKSGDMVFGDDYGANMTKVYNFLGGEGDVFDYYDVDPATVTYDEATNVYMVKFYIKDEGHWFMYHNFPEGYEIKYTTTAFDEDKAKTLTSDTVINFNYHKKSTGSYYYCYLKNYNDKEFSKEIIAEYCKGACMPLYKIREISDLAHTRAAEYKIEGGNKFVVKAQAEDDETYLFMNYIALDGFKITVNGKKAQFIENGLNFMIIKLDSGSNDVVIKYTSPYIKYGLIGALLAVFAIAAVWLANNKLKKFRPAVVTAVSIAAIALAAAVFLFFIAFPSSVFLYKFVQFLF